MAIQSLNDYIASAKQRTTLMKTGVRTTVANADFSLFELAGSPGAGVLAGTSTTAGVIPVATDAGYPNLTAFGASAAGALSRVVYSNTVPCRMTLYDRLYLAGAYPFNAAVTLASQPALTRVTDFKDLQIWIEWVTASTGNPTVAINYTSDTGATGRTTGAIALGTTTTVGRMFQMPLQAGDNGVQKIESVTATVASAGTFNVMILRYLGDYRVRSANDGGTLSMLETGLPALTAASALYMTVNTDGTSSGTPYIRAEVANY